MELKRVELAALCKKHKPRKIYAVSVLAAKFKVIVLFLPVGHPELNPIEMVWAGMKELIKKKNKNHSLSEVEALADEFLKSFDQSKWVKYIDHVKKIENQYLSVADDIPVGM